jgi:hypothetical protein
MREKMMMELDCALEPKEIEQIELFVSKLHECTSSAVSPVVDGVSHKAIATEGGKGRSYDCARE